ncbi:uncharacterized protein LOC134679561 [Cydia fagiglandana]|uniref:uncharacterized protein LOC134679561 n=1 Tax=Cydia fagiglandana TaxID=1458189 RepID=UPI002FEE3F0B
MNLHHVTLFMTLHVIHTKAQFPMQFPSAMPMPMGMPPMPMQMPIVGPPQLPSVVMPYHSRTADKFREKPRKPKRPKKKKKPKKNRYESESHSDSSDDSGSTSGSESLEINHTRRSNHKRRREVLTPVVSYVTNDGYVIYQKKIKKDRAKDWLELGKNSDPNALEIKDSESDEVEGKASVRKRRFKSRRSQRGD